MIEFKTPGVYVREVEINPPRIVRMDIAGFVGQAQRGPLNIPQLISSWGQFQDIFGDFIGHSYLSYSVFGFFRNGGRRCYVVRVAHETAIKAEHTFLAQQQTMAAAPELIKVTAINEGTWGNDLYITIEAQSANDLKLTELQKALGSDQTTGVLKSVAGLSGENTAISQPGDLVTLIHPQNPFIRKVALEIKNIDFETNSVTFAEGPGDTFPEGSAVMGKGFKITVRYQPGGILLREEVFDNLALGADHERNFLKIINGSPEPLDYLKKIADGNSILVRVENACSVPFACPRPQRSTHSLEDGSDGQRGFGENAYRYYTGYDNGAYFRPIPPGAPLEEKKKLAESLFGLASLEPIAEIGAVVLPDLIIQDFFAEAPENEIPREGPIFAQLPFREFAFENLKRGQRDMLLHCLKMGERFAVLDPPRAAEISRGRQKIEDWVDNFNLFAEAKYGALYYPWIREKAADFQGRDLLIPPGGHIAGIYAQTDSQTGVGKAPANQILQGIIELEFCLNDAGQALLNPRGVNCLRSFPGRGIRVWGARTLSRDSMWRYVNIRRVCLFIVKNIYANMQWAVFEPNTPALWDQIVNRLSLYLQDLFLSGALAGATPEEAFFVKCDQETNPPEVVDLGQVITRVGFAPARPAEFVVVTIKRTPDALSIQET